MHVRYEYVNLIGGIDIVFRLRRQLPLQHFNTIRNLDLAYVLGVNLPTYQPEQKLRSRNPWTRFWLNLASMQGLRNLRVRFHIPYATKDTFASNEGVLLRPARELLAHVKNVDLVLPWSGWAADSESGILFGKEADGSGLYRLRRVDGRTWHGDKLRWQVAHSEKCPKVYHYRERSPSLAHSVEDLDMQSESDTEEVAH